MIIKLLLLAALCGAMATLMRGRPSALTLLLRRSVTVLTIAVAALAVLFPSSVTAVANAVGVGRGADLVLYALCVTFLFVTIASNLRFRDLDDRFVELARKHALLEASLVEVDLRTHEAS